MSGGYTDKLDLFSCKYIPINQYFLKIRGFFELRKKLKHSDFKKNIESKLSELDISNQIVFRVCCLEDSEVFNGIIKFIVY